MAVLIIKLFIMKIKQHKILPSGVHAIVDQKNRVHIYTELEYQQLAWWQKVKLENGWK